MKEYEISMDEVKDHLEELDKHVQAQKEVDEALGNFSPHLLSEILHAFVPMHCDLLEETLGQMRMPAGAAIVCNKKQQI